MKEKFEQVGKAATGWVAALLLGPGRVLLQALVLALSRVMDPLWASLLVGVVVGGLGFVLVRGAAAMVGRRTRPRPLRPPTARAAS